MKNRISINLSLLVIITILYASCSKEKQNSTTTSAKSIISGIVVDETGSPLSGVTVTAYSETDITKPDGSFLFTGVSVSNNRYIVSFSKPGYFGISRSGDITAGNSATILAGMISKTSVNAASVSFASSTGGILLLTNSNCQITFPANDFVVDASGAVYTGNVNAYASYIDPSQEGFSKYLDGGDFMGKDLSGNENILQMYSGLIVELLDDGGNRLNLNQNVKATCTVQFTIPASLVGNAPSSMGIWGYSLSSGQQTQSGTSSRVGDKVVTQIAHFSSWNCNVGYTSIGTVTGYVKDINNVAIPGVKVTAGQTTVLTDNTGKYSCKIQAATSIVVDIVPDYYGSIIPPQNVTASANQTVEADFSVPVMRNISGNLKNCSGQSTTGNLILMWSFNSTNYFSSSLSNNDGTFSLPMSPGGTNAVIYAYGNGASCTTMIDTVNNLGTLTLCPPAVTGTNQFSIQGGAAFPNLMTYSNFSDTKTGTYFSNMNYTYIQVQGTDGFFSIEIPGKTTGTFTVGNAFVVLDIGITTPSFNKQFSSGTIQVTKFDNVYGLIEGTFTGTNSDTSGVFHITNGKFSVDRQPDSAVK